MTALPIKLLHEMNYELSSSNINFGTSIFLSISYFTLSAWIAMYMQHDHLYLNYDESAYIYMYICTYVCMYASFGYYLHTYVVVVYVRT